MGDNLRAFEQWQGNENNGVVVWFCVVLKADLLLVLDSTVSFRQACLTGFCDPGTVIYEQWNRKRVVEVGARNERINIGTVNLHGAILIYVERSLILFAGSLDC